PSVAPEPAVAPVAAAIATSRPAATVVTGGLEELPALVVAEGGRPGERFPVIGDLSLGRQNADVVLDDPEVSREHAVVRQVPGGGLEIADANSANGTFVNGIRIDGNQQLSDGDLIRLGKTTLKVELPLRSAATVIAPAEVRTVVAPPQGS